jgi:hypothetical protein
MPLKTFPTEPVALPGVGALVNYVGFAIRQLNCSSVVSVALINAGHVVPFQPLKKKKRGSLPKPSFFGSFLSALRSIRLFLGYS